MSIFRRLVFRNTPKLSWRNRMFKYNFSTKINEESLMESIKSMLDEQKNLEGQEGTDPHKAFLDDPRWDIIMNEIRDVDPYTASWQLAELCSEFAGDYNLRKAEFFPLINKIQDEGLDDPDCDLSFLFLQNVIERCHDNDKIREALKEKIYLSALVRNKQQFDNSLDRLLTDHRSELTDTYLIELYYNTLVIGFWHSVPILQDAMDDIHIGELDELCYGLWNRIQTIYGILSVYNFKIPEYDAASHDFSKVKNMKEKLRVDSVKYEDKYEKYMDEWKVNGEYIADWRMTEFDEADETGMRHGALRLISFEPEKPPYIGPCFNNHIQCRCIFDEEYDQETGILLVNVKGLLMDGTERNKYVGTRFMSINERVVATNEVTKVFEYSTDIVMEIE